MALTEAGYKKLAFSGLDTTAYTAEIEDGLWDTWYEDVQEESDEELKRLKLRRAILTFLQAKYSTEVNVTMGRNKREASQKFKAISDMLADVEGKISDIEPIPAGRIGTLGSAPRKQTIMKGSRRRVYSCGTSRKSDRR